MQIKFKKSFYVKAVGSLMLLVLCLCASANAATAPLVYAYNATTNRLVAFRADSPSVLRDSVALSGLNSGEVLSGIDFRPNTGQLYGSGIYVSGGNTFIRYLTINPWTGVVTQVGTPVTPANGLASFYGFDFSPQADVIRQTDADNKNFRFFLSTQTIITDTNLSFVPGDPGTGTPAISHLAYMNSFPGSTSTTLYGIDFNNDKLVRIGGVNASPSPNLGQVTTIGSLGISTGSSHGGFDIYGTSNTALAALRVAGTSRLYQINLTSGAATLIGNIGNGTDLINGLAVAPENSRFDFDGDYKADLSIFRPAPGEWWYLRSIDGTSRTFQFGTSTDKLVPGDYTGDGKADIAFWRPSTGQWFILRSNDSTFYAFPFGANGDVPVPADYDGDQRIDAAVFRPSTQTWFLNKSNEGTEILTFGSAGDKPVTGDYDGDGRGDLAIFRPTGGSGSGEWWIRRSSTGQTTALQFGTSTDKPVQADYTGDGKTDIAFFRPSNGNWFVLRSENLSFYSFPFGASGDLPVAADYDGDGKADPAVFRASNTTWYANQSTAGTVIQGFGASTDVPIPNVFVP